MYNSIYTYNNCIFMAKSDDWRKVSVAVCATISNSSGALSQTLDPLLQELNAFVYPVDGLPTSVSV